jgi:hypothetical protein
MSDTVEYVLIDTEENKYKTKYISEEFVYTKNETSNSNNSNNFINKYYYNNLINKYYYIFENELYSNIKNTLNDLIYTWYISDTFSDKSIFNMVNSL